MVARGTLRKGVYVRIILITGMTLIASSIIFNRYKQPADPRPEDESLQRECDRRVESINRVNRELSARIAQIQEELRITAEERDSLKEDKSQLLFMVEKLEQQSGGLPSPAKSGSPAAKTVRSWQARIAELRNARLPENAAGRNEYINDVNEVVRGLKEDFAGDVFITGIGYSKTTSSVKSDIIAAQRKLDGIAKYLKATYSPGAD